MDLSPAAGFAVCYLSGVPPSFAEQTVEASDVLIAGHKAGCCQRLCCTQVVPACRRTGQYIIIQHADQHYRNVIKAKQLVSLLRPPSGDKVKRHQNPDPKEYRSALTNGKSHRQGAQRPRLRRRFGNQNKMISQPELAD